MSTLVLEDVGASTPGEPLRLRFDSGGGTDVVFEVDDAGVLQILADGEEIILGLSGFPSGADLVRVHGQLGVNSAIFASTFQVVGSTGQLITFFNQHASPSGIRMLFTQSPNNTIQTFEEWEDGTTLRAEIRSNGGLANFQSNDVDLSDADLKVVEPGVIPSTWNRIKALDIVSYRYRDAPGSRPMIGVTAQQVETVDPDWFADRHTITYPEEIIRGRDGRIKATLPARIRERPRMVYNKDIFFSAIRAVQECMERIEALETP